MSVTDVAKSAMSSVVSITNVIKYQQNGYSMFGSGDTGEAEEAASGSGVIIYQDDDEIWIVTNHHVVEDAESLSVQFVDGTSADASLKGEDSDADIALLSVKKSDLSSDTLSAISVATFGDSDAVEVGNQVVAIGNALGYGQSVTTGIISAKDRDLESSDGSTMTGLLQTDAAINPGNSGGGLFNMQGQLIGINVAKYSSTDVEGMGYSIPASKVIEVVNELAGRTSRQIYSESERGYLGIQMVSIDASTASTYNMPEGVYIYSVVSGGAADEAGLQSGDIITSFDGTSVSDADELKDIIKYYKSGETVTVTVERAGDNGYESKDIQVTLGDEASATQTTTQSSNTSSTNSWYSLFR
jgi:serine protease Do